MTGAGALLGRGILRALKLSNLKYRTISADTNRLSTATRQVGASTSNLEPMVAWGCNKSYFG